MINFYLPQFSGILEKYWGRNPIHFHSEYVGAATLVVAMAAFARWSSRGRRRFLWFWAGTAVVTLLWGLGGSTPFFRLVYEVVPGTKFFRAPMTMLFITTFATAVLAALGTERLLAGRVSARFAIGWFTGGAALTLFAVVGGFDVLAHNVAASPELADRIEANSGAVRLGALRSFAFLALTCGTCFALARKRIAPALAGWSLVAIVGIDLWSIERHYWSFLDPARQLYASDATIEYLRRQPQPTRVIALPLSNDYVPSDPLFGRDALMVHRIRAVLGYHGNELGRFDLLGDADQNWRQAGNPTFWALTNAHFFLTNTDSTPIDGAKRVAGPVKDAAGSTVSLFELPGEQPFAWVAPVIVKYPDKSVLEAFRSPNFPVRAVALFDTSSKVSAATITALPDPLALTATVVKYEPGRIMLSLSAPAPMGSALVVSENYYPGWHATVDGKPVNVERADFVLMGIPLPEGARQVELTFSSNTYRTGKRITITALILALLLAGGGLALERRVGGEREARA